MATIRVPNDFKEFLQLLGSERVQYLLVGGYAVGFHGNVRPTGDLDVWVAVDEENAARIVSALNRFGFTGAAPEMFLTPGRIIRMGVPPLRIEILTQISGVSFDECFAQRMDAELDGVAAHVIDLRSLIANKKAAARAKDLADVEALAKPRRGADSKRNPRGPRR